MKKGKRKRVGFGIAAVLLLGIVWFLRQSGRDIRIRDYL